jgi:hypothetical protein
MRRRLCSTACLLAVLADVPLAQRAPSIRTNEVVSNAGAAISGHVTDAASVPVARYSVVVFPVDRSTWFVKSRVLKLARPTPDGSFEVTGLPPGEYFVAATDPIEGSEVSADSLQAETLEQLSYRATRVLLTERQRVITVLRLIRR